METARSVVLKKQYMVSMRTGEMSLTEAAHNCNGSCGGVGPGKQVVPPGPRMKEGKQELQTPKPGAHTPQPGTELRQKMAADNPKTCCSNSVNCPIRVARSCSIPISFHSMYQHQHQLMRTFCTGNASV